jgi:hypothetical protein
MLKAPYVIEAPTRTFEEANRKVTEAELLGQVAVKDKKENMCILCLSSICNALLVCCAF